MSLRQYFTPSGTVEMEPTQEELDREFEMKITSPDMVMLIATMAELTGKTEKDVKDSFKKNYKG